MIFHVSSHTSTTDCTSVKPFCLLSGKLIDGTATSEETLRLSIRWPLPHRTCNTNCYMTVSKINHTLWRCMFTAPSLNTLGTYWTTAAESHTVERGRSFPHDHLLISHCVVSAVIHFWLTSIYPVGGYVDIIYSSYTKWIGPYTQKKVIIGFSAYPEIYQQGYKFLTNYIITPRGKKCSEYYTWQIRVWLIELNSMQQMSLLRQAFITHFMAVRHSQVLSEETSGHITVNCHCARLYWSALISSKVDMVWERSERIWPPCQERYFIHIL